MKNISKIEIFEKHKIRKSYNEELEIWVFSVTDIIQALEVSPDSRNYWKVLKSNLKNDGSQLVTKINQLKMVAEDGKMRLTSQYA